MARLSLTSMETPLDTDSVIEAILAHRATHAGHDPDVIIVTRDQFQDLGEMRFADGFYMLDPGDAEFPPVFMDIEVEILPPNPGCA